MIGDNQHQTSSPEGLPVGDTKRLAPADNPIDPGSVQARRRFLKAGLIGVPMILTLSSRSAWGASGNASAFYGTDPATAPSTTSDTTSYWWEADGGTTTTTRTR